MKRNSVFISIAILVTLLVSTPIRCFDNLTEEELLQKQHESNLKWLRYINFINRFKPNQHIELRNIDELKSCIDQLDKGKNLTITINGKNNRLESDELFQLNIPEDVKARLNRPEDEGKGLDLDCDKEFDIDSYLL